MSQQAYCTQHGLKAHQFSYWKHQLASTARLSLDSIDWRHRVVTLEPGKNRRQLRLPMTDQLFDALVDYIKTGRAGIDSSRRQLHRFRHTMATRLLKSGASIKYIADVLGHQSYEASSRY